MADKTVSVRLRAQVDDYVAGMGKAAKATDQTTKAASSGFSLVDDKLQSTAKNLTSKLALPLAAAGVAAEAMSVKFDTTFGRMVGLAGVATGEVEGLKKSVMGLAGETGRGPQELAEALYFIRSAGLDGKAAMDALEVSAKAAAAGLGTTAGVADAVTSAMNGYGPSVLSAAEATDVLVATAREGKAEASELAPQFGRLIPIAVELGVSFEDVGAGMAFLSRSSGDAALSATQLDGVMQKLLKPSQQGAEALAAVGESTDTIRQSIRDKGLLQTLLDLREQLGDSGFTKFFDDVQGLQGALALTRDGGELAIPVFDALGDSAGSADSAFASWAQTMGSKNQKAFAELQVSLIQLGDALAPVVGKVADASSAILTWFNSLSDGSKEMVVLFGASIAAMGPAITIAGNLTKAVNALGTAYQWAKVQASFFVTDGLSAMSLGAPAAIAATAAVVIALKTYGDELGRAKSDADAWSKSFIGSFDPAKANMSQLQGEIRRLTGAADGMQDAADNAINPFLDSRLKTARDNLEDAADPLQDLANKAWDLQRQLGITADEALELAQSQDFTSSAAYDAKGALDAEAASAEIAAGKIADLTDKMVAQFDSNIAYERALNSTEDALAKVAELTAAGKTGTEEYQRAVLDARAAVVSQAEAAADQAEKLALANGETFTAQDRNKVLVTELTKVRDTLAPGSPLRAALDGYIGRLGSVPKNVTTKVDADTSAAQAKIGHLRAALQGLAEGTVTVKPTVKPGADSIRSLLDPNRGQERWGGVVHAFAAGGIAAHVARGERIKYAEPETGGEAYIPRLGDRARSIAVLQEAASWYGLGLASAPGPFVVRSSASLTT